MKNSRRSFLQQTTALAGGALILPSLGIQPWGIPEQCLQPTRSISALSASMVWAGRT
ncbi:twin-arginine translocation signal domain-containing protein [Puia sp. P3]|uniref:twin-arginine translocation signal domain-containing protein n=1 Tax=Puia sp. P3 TaxID=3423952 RepID=UPI003D66495F